MTAVIDAAQYSSQQRELANVLQRNPNDSEALFGLGNTLERGQAIDVAGKKLTDRDCFAQAAAADSRHGAAWYNLGSKLKPREETTVGKDRVTDRKCYQRAVEADPEDSDAWNNLGVTIPAPMKAPVTGLGWVDQKQCFQKAAEVDWTNARAWRNLESTMKDGETVIVGQKQFDRAACGEASKEAEEERASRQGGGYEAQFSATPRLAAPNAGEPIGILINQRRVSVQAPDREEGDRL